MKQETANNNERRRWVIGENTPITLGVFALVTGLIFSLGCLWASVAHNGQAIEVLTAVQAAGPRDYVPRSELDARLHAIEQGQMRMESDLREIKTAVSKGGGS